MNKSVLKKIDVLVYPFHGLNSTLETPQGILKFIQWTKQIEFASKSKDTAFIIVQDYFSEENVVREKFERFLSKQLGSKFIVINSGVSGMSKNNLINFFRKIESNFVLPKKVEVRLFGNYVPGASVEKIGSSIISQLKSVFEKAGVGFSQRIVNGLSVKQSEAYFTKIVSKRLKHKLSSFEELLILSLGLSLKREGSIKPVSVAHLIKKSNSVSEIRSNFNALKNELKKK